VPIGTYVETELFPWRQLGALLVEQELLTPDELEQALAEQRQSGRLLGRIIVDRGYLSAFSLARVLSEQHGVELRAPSDADVTAPAEREPAGAEGSAEGRWQPLGELLVERGFLTRPELHDALAEQRRTRVRLGELLVSRGILSGPVLGRLLAEQHGVDVGWLSEHSDQVETSIRPARSSEPIYRVHAVTFRHGFQERKALYESPNFLEAADFATELVYEEEPDALEIERIEGSASETVWTYSESRAAAAHLARQDLVDTFGFDPTRWGSAR
jgi:hypothetical protein